MTKQELQDFTSSLQKKSISVFSSIDAYDSKLYLMFEGHGEPADIFEKNILAILQKFNLKKSVYAHTCHDKTSFPVYSSTDLVIGLFVFDIRDKSIRNDVVILKDVGVVKNVRLPTERVVEVTKEKKPSKNTVTASNIKNRQKK